MIVSNDAASDEEWDAMVNAAPSAIYFQTRQWFKIWSEYAGFQVDTRLIRFESGKAVLLPLAHAVFLRGLVKVSFFSPKGMGGFVTNAALTAAEKHELFQVLKRLGMAVWVANPYDSLTNEFDAFNSTDFTQVLDLSQGFASTLGNWSKGHSHAARQGLRAGVSVEIGSGAAAWRSYFALYEETLRRWGARVTNKYDWPLFDLMRRKNQGQTGLWLARFERRVIAGAICFYQNRHAAWWHSASDQLGRSLHANHVLQYHITRDACDRGYQFYDLLPSGGLENVVQFKNGFSPQRKTIHMYISPPMLAARAVRGNLRNTVLYRALMRGKGF